MNENENNDNIIENENIDEVSENITSGIKEKGKGLAISSVVLGAIALLVGAFCLFFSVYSVILTNKGGSAESVGEAIGAGFGAVFMAIYVIILAILDGVISITSLGLGVGSLSKSCGKKTKSVGIAGVTLSGLALLFSVISLVLRFALIKQ